MRGHRHRGGGSGEANELISRSHTCGIVDTCIGGAWRGEGDRLLEARSQRIPFTTSNADLATLIKSLTKHLVLENFEKWQGWTKFQWNDKRLRTSIVVSIVSSIKGRIQVTIEYVLK